MKISRHHTQGLAKGVIWVAAFSTLAVMILILYQVLREGLPLLHLDFFLQNPRQQTGSKLMRFFSKMFLTYSL